MGEITLNIGVPSVKKTATVKLSADDSKALIGKIIGETFKGELIDQPGYEFQITGGSSNAGFPMRSDIEGSNLKRILTYKSVGVRAKSFRIRTGGLRKKKTIACNTVSEITAQVNLKAVKEGKKSFWEAAEEPKEAADPDKEKAPEAAKAE